MKHAKGWEEEEDDYALFASPSNKKGLKKAFKGRCGYLWRIWTQSSRLSQQEKQPKQRPEIKNSAKEKQHVKGDSKGKGHLDISKINCFNRGEYGHFPRTA